jgi:hypothetical protein
MILLEHKELFNFNTILYIANYPRMKFSVCSAIGREVPNTPKDRGGKQSV